MYDWTGAVREPVRAKTWAASSEGADGAGRFGEQADGRRDQSARDAGNALVR